MKQIIQDLKTGSTLLEEVPVPIAGKGQLLIRTTHSLVSLGTERMLVEFGKAGFINKARQQPEKVKQVLDKMKTDGAMPTVEAVFSKLNQPLPLGYCNVGVVEEVGRGVSGFSVGDRVASNGHHAEYVSVPENLAVKIPDSVTNEEAAFTVIGSIALQGIRLCSPTFGETIVVIGLGLVGLVAADLLKANGCRVIGYDFDQHKVDIAAAKGINAFNPADGINPVDYVNDKTEGIGADGVIITASNSSDEIIHQAAEMSRKRGRIILVGVVGLHINRADFYEKELTFQVSCSYGPGRYDDTYELKGQDYPIGYVRWTEKRNFEAVLHAIETLQLDVKPLITERVPFEQYDQIYGDMWKEGSVASILVYPQQRTEKKSTKRSTIQVVNRNFTPAKGVLGIIGAGNFTSSTIIPSLKHAEAQIKTIASAHGLSGKILAKKAGIASATSDYKQILADPDITAVLITTRHNLHAPMVLEALQAGKHVFVEKPLCLTQKDLQKIIHEKQKHDEQKASRMLVVGFNRRFAPLAEKLHKLMGDSPMNITAVMNAGFIPKNFWVHDLETGGGRIIGEACHFIDLCTYLTGSRVQAVCMNSLGVHPKENTDNASIVLKYENGSNAVIHYFANGSKAYQKERIEIHSQNRTAILENWRKLKVYGVRRFKNSRTRMDKGHKNQFRKLVQSLQTGVPIIPFDEIVNTTQTSFAAIESLKEGRWVEL